MLRNDRQYGSFGGESPISFMALNAFAERYDLRGAQFETFILFMGLLDAEWLEHVQRELDKKPKADPP